MPPQKTPAVRPALAVDTDGIVDAVLASGLFGSEDIGVVVDLLNDYFADATSSHLCLVSTDDDVIDGVAYAQPAPAADRVWYLTMIAVRPDGQRTGIGGALLGAVENALGARGQRLLLVETSALPQYESARLFYERAGYKEEARVRDFHEDGDDMVLYRKRLVRATSEAATNPASLGRPD